MTNRQRVLLGLLTILLLAAYPLGRAVLFVVNERELAVVLRFGEPVAAYDKPGLYVKTPFIDVVHRLPKSYQFWSAAGGEILTDLPTADGKKVEVTPWAVWRITDPIRFVQRLRSMENAETRVQTFVRGEMRDVITTNSLAEVVRSSDRKLTYTFQVEPSMMERTTPEEKRAATPSPETSQVPSEEPLMAQPGRRRRSRRAGEIVARIKGVVQQRLARTDEGDRGGRGIEVVDVGIARIDFVPVVQQAAFDRLIAFMDRLPPFTPTKGNAGNRKSSTGRKPRCRRFLAKANRRPTGFAAKWMPRSSTLCQGDQRGGRVLQFCPDPGGLPESAQEQHAADPHDG